MAIDKMKDKTRTVWEGGLQKEISDNGDKFVKILMKSPLTLI